MKKLEKLTPAQVGLMEVVRNEWINKALGGNDDLDVEAFKKGIAFIYGLAGLKDPIKVYVDSPLGVQYACHLLRTIKNLGNKKKVGDQVRDQVRDQVWDQVGAQVRDQVGDQVWAQVWDQVWAQVWDQVWAQVRDQVGDQYESFAYTGLSYDSGWNAFYHYFDQIDIKTTDNWKEYKKFLDSGIWDTVLFEGVAIGCRRPNKILRNDQNFLHCDEGPAIAWRDGYKLYYLNGVHFPEELYRKVISGNMPFEDILAIEDIDQRTQAMRFGDQDAFFKEVKAQTLDTYEKTAPTGEIVHYELKLIPKGNIFDEDVHFLAYSCPSTGKKYMSGVPPFKTVAEAGAWKMSDDKLFKVTPKQWMALQPLVTES